MIRRIHDDSDGTYGMPRVHAELVVGGCQVGRKRVARLMRESGLVGVSRRRGARTTRVDRNHRAAPDRIWVADVTYVPTWNGFVYLAIVLDVFSRKVVGWAMANHLRTELVLEALNMAIARRRPEGVIHHSDKGTQYTSLAFGKRCREKGIVPSTGSTGDCYDNAMAESFFATLECELIDRRSFQTHAEARMDIFAFLEGWYNTKRRHSRLGYLSPNEFERHAAATAGRPKATLAAATKPASNPARSAGRRSTTTLWGNPQLRSPREIPFNRLLPTSVLVATALNRPPKRGNPRKMFPRLAFVALRTAPMPYRVLKLAENYF